MRKGLIILLVVLIVGGAIGIVATTRPELNKTRDATVTAWTPLVQPLNARYAALAVLVNRLDAVLLASGEDNSDLKGLQIALVRWNAASKGTDAQKMVDAADDLEARIGQLRAVLGSSVRLTQSATVSQASTAFNQAIPPAALVTGYNEAVRKYQRTRESSVRRLTAQLFGYDAASTFEPSLQP